jgi:hypothetical protein
VNRDPSVDCETSIDQRLRRTVTRFRGTQPSWPFGRLSLITAIQLPRLIARPSFTGEPNSARR